ncbi:MAG: TonB family protein [Gammaproteobacteria bacterium]
MPHAERFAWLRRDGGPLVVSLVLHVAAALLIAPWLVMRTIPAPQVEVEVMLEPQAPEPPRSRPERAARVRSPARPPQMQPATPPVPTPPRTAAPTSTPERPVEAAPARPVAAPRPGKGLAGRSTATPRETAGLSAPQGGPVRHAAQPASSGPTALVRGSADQGAVEPRAPSAGSTPQPSARPAVLASRPGEDRDDGPQRIDGPLSQVEAVQPEFRHAARLGGQSSLRGGGRAPEEGLARHGGAPGQTALVAARAVPQALTGSGGSPGGAVAVSPASRPAGGGPAVRESGPASPSTLAAAALAGTGAGVSPSGGAPAGTGLASAGLGSGSRTTTPGERTRGLAAATAAAPTAGGAAEGSGSGAGTAGVGYAQHPVARASLPTEVGSTRLAASTGASVPSGGGVVAGEAQLSDRGEPAAAAQPMHEARADVLRPQVPVGEARVIEERFTAPALKVASPRSVCELPLLFAGFDRKPIPKGLDTINAAEPMPGEIPPRHHPSNQAPRYPVQALGQRAEGRALVRAEVRADGAVGQLWIKQTSGFQALDLAALETVRGWRFQPAQRHGMAVAMWMDVPIEYKLP